MAHKMHFYLFNLVLVDSLTIPHKAALIKNSQYLLRQNMWVMPMPMWMGSILLQCHQHWIWYSNIKGERLFKYRVDFDTLEKIWLNCTTAKSGQFAVPAGPIQQATCWPMTKWRALKRLLKRFDIPLIIDNAYGMPFPNIIYSQTTQLEWQIILCFSLSKSVS